LFRKHLRVEENHGQRRVDFVSHTRRQQSDGGKFIGLGKLGFELDTLGDCRPSITSRPDDLKIFA